MTVFWQSTLEDADFSLILTPNNDWIITNQGKTVLRYNETARVWWTKLPNGKFIKIPWPTFKDILIEYSKQVKEAMTNA